MQLTPVERAAADAFCARVRSRFGARVRALKLFGSRARGDAHAESDIDVCVVVAALDWREKHEVYGIGASILDDFDVVLSLYVLSAEHLAELHARERAIAFDLEREGIAL